MTKLTLLPDDPRSSGKTPNARPLTEDELGDVTGGERLTGGAGNYYQHEIFQGRPYHCEQCGGSDFTVDWSWMGMVPATCTSCGHTVWKYFASAGD